MSGHSKWSTIKRQKGKTDAQRGKIFTKIGREIAVAVKSGGTDPVSNARLRDIIAKAKASNMPNDNISRSIKKASGELNLINYESVIYEGYGPNGIAVIVETLTDNKNRTAGEIRYIFDRAGGAMGTNGCVSYLFETKGVLQSERTAKFNEDDMMMLAIECGAEDFFADDEIYEIRTSAADFASVREALEKRGVGFIKSEIERLPASTVEVTGDILPKVLKMLDQFEDNDDVQQVFHNAVLPQTECEG